MDSWQAIQYAGVEKGVDEPHPDNSWYRASKQLEMAVRANKSEVNVWTAYNGSLKYKFVRGVVEADGYARYEHCRGLHPDLYFCYVGTKLVYLQAVALTPEGQWEVNIVGQITGDVITSVTLSPMKTVAFARDLIEKKLRDEKLLVRCTILEITTFDGVNSNTKIKKSPLELPVEAHGKRFKLVK